MIKGLDEIWSASVIPMPIDIWSLVSWASFFFKLASFAFAFPIVSLIVFDFFLWVWRLIRPPPQSGLRSNRHSPASTRRTHKMGKLAAHHIATVHSTATGVENAERRTGYNTNLDG